MLRSSTRHLGWRRRWFGSMGERGRFLLSSDQQNVLDEQRMATSRKIAIIEGEPGTGKSVCAASFLLDAGNLLVPTLVFAPPSESSSSSIPMLRHVQDQVPLGYLDAHPHLQVQSFAQWCQTYNDDVGIASTQKIMNYSETSAFVMQHLDAIPYPPLRSTYKSPPMLHGAIKDLLTFFRHLERHGISPQEYSYFVRGLDPNAYTMSPDVFADFAAKQTDLSASYESYRALLLQHNVNTWHGSILDTLGHVAEHLFYLHAAATSFDRVLVDDLHAMTPAMIKVLSRVVLASAKQRCVAFTRPSANTVTLQQCMEATDSSSTSPRIPLAWSHTKLTANVQCAPSIVQAALAIRSSPSGPISPPNSSITTHSFTSICDEVQFIADHVASIDPTETVAVVCADRTDVPVILAALRSRGLPDVHSFEPGNMFEHAAVQSAHALLQALANPSTSSKYIFRLLQTSPWPVLPTTLAALMECQRKRHVPLFDVLVQAASAADPSSSLPFALDAASTAAVQSFVTVFSHLQEQSMTSTCLELLHTFFSKTGQLDSLLSPSSEDDAAASQALAAYFQVVGDAQRTAKSEHVPFVAPYLQLLWENGRMLMPKEDDVEAGRVLVLSIRTAEARHFSADTVVFAGMTDKAFPGRKPRESSLISTLPTALVESSWTHATSSVTKRKEFLDTCKERLSHLMLCAKTRIVFTASGDTPSRIVAPLWQSPTLHPAASSSKTIHKDDPKHGMYPLEHISFSQLDEYMRCPHRYYLSRVLKIEPSNAPGLVYGRSLHEGIAAWSLAAPSPHAIETAMTALTSTWESGCFRSKDEEELLMTQATDTLLSFIAFETSSPRGHIRAVELPFDVDLPEANVRLKGVWDRLETSHDDGGTYVVEFKSNLSDGPRNNQTLAESSLQLQLYMLAYARVYGVPPRGGALRSLETSHGLNDEGIVLYDPMDDERILQVVVDTVQKIRRREFDAVPSFMGCAYCPFADICPSKL
ncbi:hypothetical protein H257_01499 [Aphanomyces astaci]|uniref:UvrD-like helicase C-terminal domain-containing protein n=1 Tax=Aphanomyces astaci TaxID=112090 RepID=W4H9E9_APHAT|nr:hypothetical protein H257_01499 [Aphanomyces astaci]ETV88186.1 hypothetical protein H257_01499 [Aphanomyces astaci]|eukprot:XP_009823049.1 hypothetical protein H257_01499 [Aphanomyces astaci]